MAKHKPDLMKSKYNQKYYEKAVKGQEEKPFAGTATTRIRQQEAVRYAAHNENKSFVNNVRRMDVTKLQPVGSAGWGFSVHKEPLSTAFKATEGEKMVNEKAESAKYKRVRGYDYSKHFNDLEGHLNQGKTIAEATSALQKEGKLPKGISDRTLIVKYFRHAKEQREAKKTKE